MSEDEIDILLLEKTDSLLELKIGNGLLYPTFHLQLFISDLVSPLYDYDLFSTLSCHEFANTFSKFEKMHLSIDCGVNNFKF